MTKRSKSKIILNNHAFQSSGLKCGGVWKLQLPARTAGVNA